MDEHQGNVPPLNDEDTAILFLSLGHQLNTVTHAPLVDQHFHGPSPASFSSNDVDTSPSLRSQQLWVNSADLPTIRSVGFPGSGTYPFYGHTSANSSVFHPNTIVPSRSQMDPFPTTPNMSRMNLIPAHTSSNLSQLPGYVGSSGSLNSAHCLFFAPNNSLTIPISYLVAMNVAAAARQIAMGNSNTSALSNQVGYLTSAPQFSSNHWARNQQATALTSLPQSPSHAALFLRNHARNLPSMNSTPGIPSNGLRIRSNAFTPMSNQFTNPIPAQSNGIDLIRNRQLMGLNPFQVGQRSSLASSVVPSNSILYRSSQSDSLAPISNTLGIHSTALPTVRRQVTNPTPAQSNNSDAIRNQLAAGLTPLLVGQSSSNSSPFVAQNIPRRGRLLLDSTLLMNRALGVHSNTSTMQNSSGLLPRQSHMTRVDSNASIPAGNRVLNPSPATPSDSRDWLRNQAPLGQASSQVGQNSDLSYVTRGKFRCYKCGKEFFSYGSFGGHVLSHSKRPRRVTQNDTAVTIKAHGSCINSPLTIREPSGGLGPQTNVLTSSSSHSNRYHTSYPLAPLERPYRSDPISNGPTSTNGPMADDTVGVNNSRGKAKMKLPCPSAENDLKKLCRTDGSMDTEWLRPNKRFKGESSTRNDIAEREPSVLCNVPKEEPSATGETEGDSCPPMHDTVEDNPSQMDVPHELNDSFDKQHSSKSF